MLFSQQMERSSKGLDQRQLRLARTENRVQKVEQLAQLYEQLGHPGQASLEHMVRQARIQLLQRPSAENLLGLTGDDPARTHVVLQQVSAQAQAEGRTHEADLARDFLQQMHTLYAPQIQAGLNIAQSLQVASDDPALRQAVRQLYYASVVVRQSLATMMQALLGLFGGEQFNAGLQVMRRTLADDVAAHTPSLPIAKLRTLLLGLQACGQLNGVLCSCRELCRRLVSEHPRSEQDAITLLQRLLGYASTGIAPNEVLRLGSELGGESPSAQLVSLNVLYPLIQRLPLSLWRDERSRQETLHNFLMLMDERTTAEGRATSRLVAAAQ